MVFAGDPTCAISVSGSDFELHRKGGLMGPTVLEAIACTFFTGPIAGLPSGGAHNAHSQHWCLVMQNATR